MLKDSAWSGRRAFVVGSGPSLSGFDYSLLKNELWIGLNEEYKHAPTIALVQDPRLFNGDGSSKITPYSKDPAWTGGPHIPVYFKGHPDREDYSAPDTVFQVRSAHDQHRPFRWGQTLEEGLFYGANVGMAGINLAEILGANPIYLLGFDARIDDPKTHHHDSYPPGWTLERLVDRNAVYSRWHKSFRKIATMVRSRIVNLNPDSGIDAFEKAHYTIGLDVESLVTRIITWERRP